MIDLHTHILPGVDDGVRTEDEAVAFARIAVADGIRTLVATPHCREGFYVNERADVLAGVRKLRERLAAESIPLDVLPGAEVHLTTELPARVKDGRAPTLADNGRTLLLELSMSQYPVDVENVVFQLRLAGVQVLFAHPERIRWFQDDVRRFEEMIRLGAFGQITTGSLLGDFGESTREFSEELMRKRLVHVLASDSHNTRGRRPEMSAAVRAAANLVGESYAVRMADEFPRALLDGRDPAVEPPPEPAPPRRSFLGRWFGRDAT